MPVENDQGLILKAKQGNIHAFELLIRQHEKTVYNIAYRMFHHEEDAKDISQEVWIKVYKSLSKFEENANFTTWIYRIAVNTCIDEIRRRKGKETYSVDESVETEKGPIAKQYRDSKPTPEEQYLKKESAEIMQKMINTLSEEHKTLVILRDIQGFSYGEIAEIIPCSMGTVKSRLARARTQLKKMLSKQRELSPHKDRLINRKEGDQ